MALFRSNRGMHLLTLPTTHADAENTRRKNIQDGGTTTASRLLAQARILPQEALVFGPPGRIFPVVESLQRKSSRPFVLIGTARDLTDSPLLRLPTQWQDTVLPDRLPEGSGRITINPGEFGMGMMQMADWGGTHTILLCLGQGLSASTELLGLLRSMRYLVVSSAGGDAQTLLQVLPSYESERVTNSIGFNTHHDRGGMMGHHGGSGFSFGQNREVVTKPVLSQDDLTGLRNNSEFLVYNQDLMRLWVGKIG